MNAGKGDSPPSPEELLAGLRSAADRGLSDSEIGLLAGIYVDSYTPLPLNSVTLAGAMLMFAGVRVTAERAEMLLAELEEQGDVEPMS